jgi:hypothetical protein
MGALSSFPLILVGWTVNSISFAKAACNCRNGKSDMSKLWQILECHHFDTLGLGDQ